MIKDKLIDLLDEAVKIHATDLHFSLLDNDKILIQARASHFVLPLKTIEKNDYEKMLAYVRFHSSMDLADPNQPQSGGLVIGDGDKNSTINCRISILPTAKFQSLVLRVINHQPYKTIDELPFNPQKAQVLKDIAEKQSGLVLIGGPTSSGKTTTAYAMIHYLKNELGRSVITIEDPVEYQQPDVVQLQINDNKGMNFDYHKANRNQIHSNKHTRIQRSEHTGMNDEIGLKEILRHDPDVIVIGEIRDKTTAQNAIRAASSGHLVISTIHSKDNIGMLHRLLDQGNSVYDIDQSLVALVNQRLIPVGDDKTAIMEIAEGSNLENLMEQVIEGRVTHLLYETIDQEYSDLNDYLNATINNRNSSPEVVDEWIEVPSNGDFLDSETEKPSEISLNPQELELD